MAKFKLYGVNDEGEVKLVATESHPKTDASQSDLSDALTAATGLYGLDPKRIDLNSDTTVFSVQ